MDVYFTFDTWFQSWIDVQVSTLWVLTQMFKLWEVKILLRNKTFAKKYIHFFRKNSAKNFTSNIDFIFSNWWGGHMGGHLIQYDSRFILFCKNVSNSIIIIEKFKIEFRSKMDIWLSTLVSTWHLKWGNQHFSFHWKQKVGWYSLYSIFNLPKRSMFEKIKKS